MVVLTASASESRMARGSLRSRSVSAVTGGVAAGSEVVMGCSSGAGLVAVEAGGAGDGVAADPFFFVVCADSVAAVMATQKMISNRRTAVMKFLLDTPLILIACAVDDTRRDAYRHSRRILATHSCSLIHA